jgi:sugar lactone lactonase YvrE
MRKIILPVIFCIACSLAACKKHTHQTRPFVSTIAGNGTWGFADGLSTSAQFAGPIHLAVDAHGNIIVADKYNHRIRKITPAGMVSTLAGNGTAGNVNGPGSVAQFFFPAGVACDGQGNVYVADSRNDLIRKITSTGEVSWFAGSGVPGTTDGPAATARFADPSDIAIDANGNLYVADQGFDRIRKITPAGMVSTLAGGTNGSNDGTGSAAQFASPAGVACDAQGNVYVADWLNHRIRKITPNGVVTTLAGSSRGFADGAGTTAMFDVPQGVGCDGQGNVYVGDAGNNKIRKVTPNGVVTTYAGSTSGFFDGEPTAAQFYGPYGVTVYQGNLIVADFGNGRIRKIVLQ